MIRYEILEPLTFGQYLLGFSHEVYCFNCGNSGVMWDGVNPYPKGTASFAVYYFPSKFGMFVETYCIYSGKSSPINGGDLGFLYCVTDDLVVDISGGIDYTVGFDNSFVNCGISWRIPNKHK